MKISVVMSVYNGEDFLAEAIESVLNQTYKDFEFIIVDDGSTDSTPKILAKYQALDPRIVIDSHENMGLAVSLNRAIDMAKGEWIARIDADDIMMPNRLEEQLRFIEANPEVDVVATWVYYINEHSKVFKLFDFPKDLVTWEDNQRYFKENKGVGIIHPSVMYFKASLLKTGGYRDVNPSQDTDLWFRMQEHGLVFSVIHKPLTKYRVSSNSIVISQKLHQRYYFQWIVHNMLRRRQGLSEISRKEFMRRILSNPFGKNFTIHQEVLFRHFSKKAILALSRRKNLSLMIYACLLFLVNPTKTLKKVLSQINRKNGSKETLFMSEEF
jgi:glycosyltransferase involved in cell wall biosynthesis